MPLNSSPLVQVDPCDSLFRRVAAAQSRHARFGGKSGETRASVAVGHAVPGIVAIPPACPVPQNEAGRMPDAATVSGITSTDA